MFVMLLFASTNINAQKSPDPDGSITGTVLDVPSVKAGELTILELGDQVGKNKVAINMIWVLITGFLVMFMQEAFAMVEVGLTRAKNVTNTMTMNFMINSQGMLSLYIAGFASAISGCL